MASLGQYLDAAAHAVSVKDSATLALLFDVDSVHALGAVRSALGDRGMNVGELCEEKVGAYAPWDEIFASHCQCLGANAEGRYDDAFVAMQATIAAFVKDFRAQDTAWSLDALMNLVRGAVALATRADDEAERAGRQRKDSRLGDAGAALMLVYRNTANTSVWEKKSQCLFLVISLFKIYFKLNTLHLCKNLINAVNLPTFPTFDTFPVAQRVTYAFYVGRLAVFDDDFSVAEQHLEYAFRRCKSDSRRNKTLILRYLLPVKLLMGKMPTTNLLQKYGLGEYVDVVSAMKSGNVRMLNDALKTHQISFIKQGTFLVLEKLRNIVLRTLFQKVHAFSAEKNPAKGNQVNLHMFLAALKWCGCDMDIDEVEMIVANLIFKKFVKGYISHKSRVVVLAKAGAFPAISYDDDRPKVAYLQN